MGAEDVAGDINGAVARLPLEGIGAACGHLTEALTVLAALAAGSNQPDLHQAVAGLQQVVSQLQELPAVFDRVREAMAKEVVRLAGDGGAASVPVARPTSPATSAVRTPPADTSTRPLDERAAEIMTKLPVRTGERGQKTSGYWIDEDGAEYGPLISGHDEDYEHTRAVLRDLEIGPAKGDLLAASHVETKFAARMRGSQRKRVTLIINNLPCDDGRYSCDQLLPKILRPRSGGYGVLAGR
ncbi:DddA-like double-stranded DNA deaminase toxin [Actinokineospora sp.]|uniref:DddA-like double-stranded DNA deaminase toxin n=1 Tax=Actinokineospora sp. TaxID=1872133 RepID=UPI003D6A4AFD